MIQQEFLSKLELSKYIINDMTPAEKLNMLDKYNNLADAVINKLPISTFSSDSDNYRIILNSHVFNLFMRNTAALDRQAYPALNKMYLAYKNGVTKLNQNSQLKDNALENKIKNDTYNKMGQEFAKRFAEIGIDCNAGPDLDTNTLQVALQTFGLNTADGDTVPETTQTDNTPIDNMDKFKDMFDDEELLDNMDEEDTDEDTYENDASEEEDDNDPEIEFDLEEDEEDNNQEEDNQQEKDNQQEEDSEQAPQDDEDEEMPEDEPEKSKEETDYFEAFKQVYEGADGGSGTPLRAAIDGIMLSLHDLYMSCFSGITSPDGILTNKGLLSLDKIDGKYKFVYNHTDIDLANTPVTSKKYIKYKNNSSEYNKRYKAAMYALGVTLGGAPEISVQSMDQAQLTQCINNAVSEAEHIFGTAIDGRKSALPKYEDANSTNYYPRLHTEFMTGNFSVCKEMREWAEKNKAKRNAYKITNFKDLMKWARVRVSDCLTQALIDAGLKIEDAGNNDGEVTAICQVMAKKIKNIIVITNSRKSHFTLKICTSQIINGKMLEKGIKDYFNAGSAGSKSTSIIIKNGGSESGVTELDVILNMEDYDASSRLSSEVIDDILETGNVPSWSNAILGEKNNGGAFTYNFKKKTALAIYGKTGSGKGVMTSALLTNALAEGCAVLYVDGKPDNGAALGKVAWDAGVDAPVFNGWTNGSKEFQNYLEEYSHGIRSDALDIRQNQIDKIPEFPDNPDWPLNTTKLDKETGQVVENVEGKLFRKKLYETSVMLNSYNVVCNIIAARTRDKNLEILPNGKPRHAVIVIDEIETAATNEKDIREAFERYMEVVGKRDVYKTEINSKGEQVEKKDGKISDPKNWNKDPGYLFCKTWLDWVDRLCSGWIDLVNISLRNSSTTLIVIFQSNGWLNRDDRGGTKIGKMTLQMVACVTKIAGKNGISGSTNKWGDLRASDYEWQNELDKGKWVISSEEKTLKDTDTVFKPFKIYTTDLGQGVKVQLDDIGAGANQCWKSKEDKQNPELRKPCGLQAYLKYLFNGLQDELQIQLQNGERLDGTLTPEGVLKTSFDYFNRITDNRLVEKIYKVEPINEFNTSVSEADTEQMAQRLQEAENSDLDDLNDGLDNSNSEDQQTPIDFGGNDMPTPEKNPANGPMPIPGQKTNSTGDNPLHGTNPNQNVLDQAKQEVEQINNLKLMTTKQLRMKNFSDNVLEAYYNKILNKNGILANNNYDYTNRSMSLPRGLYQAAITFSSICYMEKEVDRFQGTVGKLKLQATEQIKALNDRYGKWKFMLGMIEDYMNDVLAYDEMPSEDKLREYQQKYIYNLDFDTGYGYGTDDYDSDGQNYSDDGQGWGDNSSGNEDDFDQRSIWDEDPYDMDNNFNTGNRNGVIDITPPPNGDTVRLSLDNYIETSAPRWHTMERFKKKLFESANGTAYEFKKRWDYVLRKIAERHPDRALVRKMAFTELHVIVNGKMMMLNNLIGGEDDIQITDILRIKDTFKKFPMIQSMTFDGPTTQCLIDEYGTTAQEVWEIFREHRALKVIEIVVPETNQQMVLKRETFPSMQEQFNRAMGIKIAQMQYEQFGSSFNNRLEEKSPGYIHRMLKNGKSKASSWFQNRPKPKGVRKPIVSKRMKYAAGALGILALGSVIGVPGLIVTGVSSAIGYFKARR